MHEHDAEVGRADAPGGLDVEVALGVEDRSADDARKARDSADTDRDHHFLEPRAEDGDDDERQQDARKAELHVDDAHEHAVRPSAEVAGEQSDEPADRGGDDDGDDPDADRHAGAVDQAQEDVAAEVVGAEQVTRRAGRLERVAEALCVRVDLDEHRHDVRD